MTPPLTQCPHCLTVFHVSSEQLEIADGLVRCGACRQVFAAAEHWVNEVQSSPYDGVAGTEVSQAYIEDLLAPESQDGQLPLVSPATEPDEALEQQGKSDFDGSDEATAPEPDVPHQTVPSPRFDSLTQIGSRPSSQQLDLPTNGIAPASTQSIPAQTRQALPFDSLNQIDSVPIDNQAEAPEDAETDSAVSSQDSDDNMPDQPIAETAGSTADWVSGTGPVSFVDYYPDQETPLQQREAVSATSRSTDNEELEQDDLNADVRFSPDHDEQDDSEGDNALPKFSSEPLHEGALTETASLNNFAAMVPVAVVSEHDRETSTQSSEFDDSQTSVVQGLAERNAPEPDSSTASVAFDATSFGTEFTDSIKDSNDEQQIADSLDPTSAVEKEKNGFWSDLTLPGPGPWIPGLPDDSDDEKYQSGENDSQDSRPLSSDEFDKDWLAEIDPPPIELIRESAGERLTAQLLAYAGIAALTLLLVAQYFWSQRHSLAVQASTRGGYEVLCQVFRCKLPEYRDLTRIVGDELLVIESPSQEGVLLAEARITNRAPFAQSFPVVELSFASIDGRLIARRGFEAHEYLAGGWRPGRLLQAGESLRFSIALIDPGLEAVNYRLRLRAAPPS